MGWPKNNPELYDEICMNGVMTKLVSMSNIGLMSFPENYIREKAEEAFECYALKMALCSWAHAEIYEAERDHFGC